MHWKMVRPFLVLSVTTARPWAKAQSWRRRRASSGVAKDFLLAGVMRWAWGRALVARAIWEASRGVIVEATASSEARPVWAIRIEAIEVSKRV
jgi:hypothetical protein